MLILQDSTDKIIGAAIEVHRELGPGRPESADEHCLCREFSRLGLSFQRHVELPVVYKSVRLNCGYVADILVEEAVLLELKSVDGLHPIRDAQLIAYLKISGWKIG